MVDKPAFTPRVQPAVPASGVVTSGVGRGFLPWVVPVETVADLLRHRLFAARLAGGLVFVHDKRPMADFLMAVVRQAFSPGAQFSARRESLIDVAALLDRVCLARPSRASRSKRFDVIQCDTEKSGLLGGIPRIAASPGLRNGLWLRGHLNDMQPHQLRMFDALFVFDTSEADMAKLRSAITLPEARVDDLKKAVGAGGVTPESTLVFVADTDRLTGERVPVLSDNPAVLPLTRSDIRENVMHRRMTTV